MIADVMITILVFVAVGAVATPVVLIAVKLCEKLHCNPFEAPEY